MTENITRNKILKKSVDVLCSVGIVKTTMNMLAEEIGLSRRTLYRYFESKEELVQEVMLLLMEQWNEEQSHTYDSLRGTSLEKLEQHFLKLVMHMESNMSVMRFMAEYDNYFKDEIEYSSENEMGKKLQTSYHVSDVLVEKLIREGIKEGTIELKDDIHKIVATMTNMLWVFGQAISIRERKISEAAGVDAKELIRCSINLYIGALKK